MPAAVAQIDIAFGVFSVPKMAKYSLRHVLSDGLSDRETCIIGILFVLPQESWQYRTKWLKEIDCLRSFQEANRISC